MKGNVKFGLGLAIGAAIGAAIAYFSDSDKRNKFVDNVGDYSGKLKDSLVEGYQDAKNRYMKYRQKMTDATEDLLDEVEDKIED